MEDGALLTPTTHAEGMMAYTFCGTKKIAPKVFNFEACVQKCRQLFPDLSSDLGLKFYTDEIQFLGGELAEISPESFEEVAKCINNLTIMLDNDIEIIDGLTSTYAGKHRIRVEYYSDGVRHWAHFAINASTRLQKIVGKIARRMSVQQDELMLTYRGQALQIEGTAADNGIVPGVAIACIWAPPACVELDITTEVTTSQPAALTDVQ